MNFILIGYRASGKTSVGKKLSGLLGLPFYDTDALIQQQTGKTVREMVREGGWPAFRQAERAAIASLAENEEAVIALGGGAVMEPRNAQTLKENGLFIWLQADEETICGRVKGDHASAEQRPPLPASGTGDERKTLAQRIPVYRALADIIVDTTGHSIEAIAREILEKLGHLQIS